MVALDPHLDDAIGLVDGGAGRRDGGRGRGRRRRDLRRRRPSDRKNERGPQHHDVGRRLAGSWHGDGGRRAAIGGAAGAGRLQKPQAEKCPRPPPAEPRAQAAPFPTISACFRGVSQSAMLDWPAQTPVVLTGSAHLFPARSARAAPGVSPQTAPPMPPMVIDLRRADDSRDVVHRAVQALAEGRAVAFPTETDYVIAASARDPAAVGRLVGFAPCIRGEPRLTLAIKGADEALDWAPRLSGIGRRIARRCWPGPVAMLVADDHPESLVHRLAPAAREGVIGSGRMRLRAPGHPMLASCLRMLAGPVVLAEPGGADQPPAVTAADVMSRAEGLAAGAAEQALSLVIDDGRSRYAQPVSTIEVDDTDFRVIHPGIVSEETLRRLSSLMVLFVCTGNTCRSPMAETILRKMLAERFGCRSDEVEARGVVVASAGIAAWGGGRASAGAIEAMAEAGCDLSGHESQPLTENLVRQADQIWTMTAAHRAAILAQFPAAGGRVAMLSPDRVDVMDPIGGPLTTYRKCARQIREHLAIRLDTIIGPVSGRQPAR
ncbi:MAG: hypothetical protein EBZ59_07355 [Planctomycetia bacterium]|nr:hypothetical protein [Planctomycetia bacterium]